MSDYNIKKAGERLIWKLKPNEKGEYKQFKPDNKDFEALTCVLGHINESLEKDRLNNPLFAKLYIYVWVDLMRKYESTMFDEMVQSELHGMLDKPIELFYMAFDNVLTHHLQNGLLEKARKPDGKVPTIEEFKATYNTDVQRKELDYRISEALNKFK